MVLILCKSMRLIIILNALNQKGYVMSNFQFRINLNLFLFYFVFCDSISNVWRYCSANIVVVNGAVGSISKTNFSNSSILQLKNSLRILILFTRRSSNRLCNSDSNETASSEKSYAHQI